MRDNLKQFTELEPCLFRASHPTITIAAVTITTTNVTIAACIRNANTPSPQYPLHFSLKFRETSAAVAACEFRNCVRALLSRETWQNHLH